MAEHRQHQRFEIRLPLQILRGGVNGASTQAWTRNISSGGVLFAAEAEVRIGGEIEYVVSLAEMRGVQVDLRCTGKVVRHDRAPEDKPPACLIAATLDRYEFVRRER